MHPALPVTVAIVHAHEVVRIGLRTALEHSGTAKVVLERADAHGLHAALPAGGVHVLLLYLGTAVQVALDAVHSLRRHHPATGVLLLGELTPVLVRRAVEARVGGLLHSAAPAEEMVKGVAVVAQGGLYMNGLMREQLLARRQQKPVPVPEVALSPMQQMVMRLLCHREHFTRERMANELGIGQRTVDTHVQALYRKLGVCNRHELLQKVLGKGRLDRQG